MRKPSTGKARAKLNPTHPRVKISIDELARLWVDIALRDLGKIPVDFSQESSLNNVIGQL